MKIKSFDLYVKDKISAFNKIIRVDSDKSLSIRSFLIGSICQNVSTVKNVLESEDVKSTILACKKLGVKIKKFKSKSYKIFGKGLGSLSIKKWCFKFCQLWNISQTFNWYFINYLNIRVNLQGDHSLNKKYEKLIDLCSMFGATFIPKNKTTFPQNDFTQFLWEYLIDLSQCTTKISCYFSRVK